MREPQQSRSRDSTERVLDAALHILETDGLAALTTARVAHDSGVSNGSIYHRFGTRRALLVAAFDRFHAQLREEATLLRDTYETPTELRHAVAAVVTTYRMIFAVHGGLIRAFFVDAIDDDELGDRGIDGANRFAEQVAAFLAPYADEISVADRELAFLMIHKLLFGWFMVRMLFYAGDPGDAAMLRTLRDAVHGMLRPHR